MRRSSPNSPSPRGAEVKTVDELSLDDVLLDEGDLDDTLYEFNDIGLPLRIAALRDAADA